MKTTQLKLHALLHDKSNGKEYELFACIHEEVNVNSTTQVDKPVTKDDIFSLRKEILNARSAITSAIYFTALTRLLLIVFCFLGLLIVLISK